MNTAGLILDIKCRFKRKGADMSNENNPNLTEMIKEIHDGVAREMYCKGVDDFVKFASDMPTVEEDNGTIRPMWLEEMAEQLKEKYNE